MKTNLMIIAIALLISTVTALSLYGLGTPLNSVLTAWVNLFVGLVSGGIIGGLLSKVSDGA